MVTCEVCGFEEQGDARLCACCGAVLPNAVVVAAFNDDADSPCDTPPTEVCETATRGIPDYIIGHGVTPCPDKCGHAMHTGTCSDLRDIAVMAPKLEWDEPATDWYDGHVAPHYIGWFEVQMRSRINDDHPAPGVTRFWYAGRDWYTGPKAIEHGAPCVPRGSIFAWRGRAQP